MTQQDQGMEIDFSVDKKNLYREESITDLKVASIRRLIPVKTDGTDDDSRTDIYIGHTQLMSPQGPVPIQAPLQANSMEEAMEAFPAAMQQALADMMERAQRMQQEQQEQERDQSRIIIPGR